jgi:hypothetical protein
LGSWVGQCRRDLGERALRIEVYVSPELLNLDFENWNYDLVGVEQLRESYLVYIRWRDRWSLADKYSYLSIWQEKWSDLLSEATLQSQSQTTDLERLIRQSETLWFNGCRVGMDRYLTKLLIHGIPMALWSRCLQCQDDHWQGINQLVANQQISDILTTVQRQRSNAPTTIDSNSNELGHHLALMWEDPHRRPPWLLENGSMIS